MFCEEVDCPNPQNQRLHLSSRLAHFYMCQFIELFDNIQSTIFKRCSIVVNKLISELFISNNKLIAGN